MAEKVSSDSVLFSLIVGTRGRVWELERLLASLHAQTFFSFEAIVIDQNDDNRLGKTLEIYGKYFKVTHLRCSPGLSRARNLGLMHACGDIFAFPDDDCWYPADLLAFVAEKFAADCRLVGLTGRSVAEDGSPSQGRWATRALTVNRYNIWTCATSYTIFLRANLVVSGRRFDETLGVGSGTRWGAGEEINYIFPFIAARMYVRYDPRLLIFHREPVSAYNGSAFERAAKYNRGLGHVLAINKLPWFFIIYMFLRPLAGALSALLTANLPRFRYYAIAAAHRIRGWLD